MKDENEDRTVSFQFHYRTMVTLSPFIPHPSSLILSLMLATSRPFAVKRLSINLMSAPGAFSRG